MRPICFHTSSRACAYSISDVDVQWARGFLVGYFFSPTEIEADLTAGRATQEEVDEFRRSIDGWADDPGAFSSMAFGEATGRKPRT